MLVAVRRDAFTSAFHIKCFGKTEALSIRIVPAREQMAARLHQLERIAEPSADRHVHDRHRGARSAGAVDHALDEEVARITKVGVKAFGILKLGVTDSCRVVAYAKSFLERL